MRSACRRSFCRRREIAELYGFVDRFHRAVRRPSGVEGTSGRDHHRRHRAGVAARPHSARIGRALRPHALGQRAGRLGARRQGARQLRSARGRRPSAPSTPSTTACPPEEAGSSGDTNGAAMRIAPVGIMMPLEPLDALVAKVAETCRATHNTSIAIAVGRRRGCRRQLRHCRRRLAGGFRPAPSRRRGSAQRIGHWIDRRRHRGADRLGLRSRARQAGQEGSIRLITDLVGTGVASQESVPAAFAVLEVAEGDPWQAAVISANLGGDTDTIGAIAAGMAGACTGMARLPQESHRRAEGHRSRPKFEHSPPIWSPRGCQANRLAPARTRRHERASCPCRQRGGRLCLSHRRLTGARHGEDRVELPPRSPAAASI